MGGRKSHGLKKPWTKPGGSVTLCEIQVIPVRDISPASNALAKVPFEKVLLVRVDCIAEVFAEELTDFHVDALGVRFNKVHEFARVRVHYSSFPGIYRDGCK